jgi:hypothetical protein
LFQSIGLTKLNCNTLYSELHCPACQGKVVSGVGFRLGAIAAKQYQVGDELSWDGAPTRPATRPKAKVVKTVGYFNCDNIRCSTWQDCFPTVQLALITVEGNRIKEVSIYEGPASDNGFDIIEPKGLS